MGVPIREFQLFQLDILKEFVRVCDKHGLEYYAAWGTLLGAARHGGFIPWDDDIDLWMPIDDYLAFRNACDESLSEGFYLQSHAKNPQNFITWQRIGLENTTSLALKYADIHGEWGVCIDIFPLGRCAQGKRPRAIVEKKLARFSKLSRKYVYRHDAKALSGVSRLYHQFMGACPDPLDKWLWQRWEKDLFAGAGIAESDACFDSDGFWGSSEWFGESVSLPFEDMLLQAPKEYAKVLERLYGSDWHEIPPEEKRVCHSGGGSEEVLVSLVEPYGKYLI